MSFLCILRLNPLSVPSFANIFNYSEGRHFVTFIVSFTVQKKPSSAINAKKEKNRMGKTRDLFKKIRDTKGTFHAKWAQLRTEMVWT